MAKINWSPFSTTALKSIYGCTGFINIWEGAVRSSKTVASIIAWLNFVESSEHHDFLMTGKTSDTLYRNVIGGPVGIINILGEKNAKFIKSAEGGAKLVLRFKNPDPEAKNKWIKKTCYCIGGNDEKSEGRVRGMTIAGWYADEVTLYPESFTKQCINRMSLSGAQAFWTCNPDSPYHPIKVEFIDKAAAKDYRVFHFELDDNLSLDDRYKESIKAAYSGLWYKRMILGLWVMADGVIYDGFIHSPEEEGGHIVDKLPQMLKWWIASDYGTSNATTFILIGLGVDKRMYVVHEYYHSGKDGKQKSPQQYSQDLKKWLQLCNAIAGVNIEGSYERIFVDPSAKGFMVQLWTDGVKRIAPADNEVKLGIELISSLIGSDRFRVHRRCQNVLRELSSYVWDPKAQKAGEDKPMKTADHTLDPIRYVANSTRTIWQHKGAA
jgi:PBSX family phage terminase large subunit